MEIICFKSLYHAFEAGEMSNSASLGGSSSLRRCRFLPGALSSSSSSSIVSLPALAASQRNSLVLDAYSPTSSSSWRSSSSSSSFGRQDVGLPDASISARDGAGGQRVRRVLASASETVSVSFEEKALEAPSGDQEHEQTFDWKSNWYPVTGEQDLDKTVPHPFQILGQKVVIWYDINSNSWKTFFDVCPHRLAPLSEGRIDEMGCIQCCYHGWSFGGDGSCTRIPQARKEGPEASAVGKVSVPTFPTIVKQGILFIWPNDNTELAQSTSPPITPEHDIEGFQTTPTFRDMNYGWDTAMENLLDPSHLHIAHHNVNGSKLITRDQAKPLRTDVSKLTPRGFSGPWGYLDGLEQQVAYEAPARTTYTFSMKGKVSGTTTTYVTPTAPGKCRVIIENGRSAHLPWFVHAMVSGKKWWQIVPRWWDHQKMLNLLDGDQSILHYQERILRVVTNDQVENWSKAFFMPTSADRFVAAFRQWITRFGGKGVKWTDGLDPTIPPLIEKKEVLLDRYDSHTKECLICRKALENFRLARTVLFIFAGLLVGGAPLLNISMHRIRAVVAAGICTFLAWRIQVEWIPMFYYKGYDHARIP